MALKKVKRIAIVLNTAWNIYNFRLGLVKVLVKEGFQVVAIAPSDAYVPYIERVGCKFVNLQSLTRKGTNPIKEILLIKDLSQIYRKECIDLVLHYTIKPVIYGTLAANQLGIPSINTITGLGYSFLSSGIINRIVASLYRFSLKKAKLVLFQNKDDLNLFLERGLVEASKSGIINGSGVNTNYFKSDIFPPTDKGLNFIFIGRLLHDKGIMEYLKAAKVILEKYKNSTFHIVGTIDKNNPAGLSEETFNTQIEQEDSIVYHGTKDDLRPLIGKSHVVVLPSYREGLPRVMLEGMAMGRPLITTDVPGCRETVIDGHNGYLVKVKSTSFLVDAMEKMIKADRKKLIEMGSRGRQIACSRFSESAIIENYLDIIKKELS